MGFLSFLAQKQKTFLSIVLHLDVGHGNSKGAVVAHTSTGPEIILTAYGAERVVHVSNDRALPLTLFSLGSILEVLKKKLSQDNFRTRTFNLKNIYCILPAPYYLSHTTLIHYDNDEPFTVTPEIISDLIRKRQKLTEEDISIRNEYHLGERPETIAERVIDIKVNGYHTSNPYGKRANSLEVALFRTEVAREVINSAKKTIAKRFDVPVIFEPLSLVAFVALRNHLGHDRDFLFVIVGHEATEISLVRSFSLLETVSFPFGKHSLLRHLGRKIKASPEVISGTLSLYQDKKMNKEERAKLEPALDSGKNEWFSFFEKSVVALSEESALPSKIFLVVDGDVKEIFSRFISTDSFASQALVPKGFSITTLDNDLLSHICRFAPGTLPDTMLAIEGLFSAAEKIPLPYIHHKDIKTPVL